MLRVLVVFLFVICSFSPAKGGLDSARFVHFDISNGLPSNNVYSFLKDKKGYMWFATDKGVVKYNGYSFTQFNTGTGLPSDDVWQLYCDNSDRIWLYSFGYEFGYIKNNKYRSISVRSDERIFYAHHLAEKGNLLYFIAGKNLDRLVLVYGDIAREFPMENAREKHGSNNTNLLRLGQNFDFYYKDKNNNVYSQSLVPGGSEKKFISKLPYTDPVLKARQNFSPVNKIYQFKFNGDNIQMLDIDNGVSKKLTLKEMGASADEKIYIFNPYYMQSNTARESILATGRYMYVIDSNLNFIKRTPLVDVLPSKSQLAYRIVDDGGNTWMSTNGDGVWLQPVKYPLYKKEKELEVLSDKIYLGDVNARSYWGDNRSRTVYELEKNKIINKIRFKDNVFFKSITGNDTILYISSIAGVFRYDKKTKEVSPLPAPDRIDIGGIDSAILTYKSVVFSDISKVRSLNNRLFTVAFDYSIAHTISKDSIVSKLIYYDRFDNILLDDFFDRILLFNKEKIFVKNERTGKNIILNKKNLGTLGIGNIKQIERDDLGNWYILDDEKITVWNVSLKRIGKLNLNVNLRGAFLKVIGNKIVLAGNFGVGYSLIKGAYSFGDLKIVPNYVVSGSNYHQVEAFSLTNDGYGLLKTDEGVFSFTVDQLVAEAVHNTKTDDLFHVIIKAPAEKKLSMNDTLSFGQEETNVVLDAVNYFGKGELIYKYLIVSNGKEVSSSSGEIFLELLKPGEYHEVRCSVKDDLYESPVYRFYIYRYPMWWQTNTWRTIFWVTGVVLFLALVLLTIAITRYYVAKKNERKRALTDLELQAIHSQINPHFIFNTLSTALFYINKKRFDDAYTHVTKFSQLLRAYLKSSQDRYVILEEEIKMLRNYIELQQLRFEEKFQYKVEIDNKLPINNIRIPSLLLQPLVENAINHGLFHRENGGILLLKFEQGSDSTVLVCTIDDNGVGREAARKINESTSNRESYGTTLTNQLLEVFKQYEKLDIKLDYTDKKLPEMGTVVTLTLKNIKYVA